MASTPTRIVAVFFTVTLIPSCIHAALITAGSVLVPPGRWNSSDGSFSLGFFNFTPDSYYVGVWFARLLPFQQANVVWVANRDRSVSVNSSLVLLQPGGLQLINSFGAAVWQAGNSKDNLVAEMMDTGNFVLREALSNSTVWETFGNPTDTILPGQNMSSQMGLIAWTTSTNPSPSKFSLTLADSANVRLLFSDSIEYWSRPGTELSTNGSVAVFNQSSHSLLWNEGNCVPNGPILKMTLSVDGNLRLFQWLDTSSSWKTLWRALYVQCDVFNTCGDNGICNYDQNLVESTGNSSCPMSEANYGDICTCPLGFYRRNEDGNCAPAFPIECSKRFIRLPDTTFGLHPLGAPTSTNGDENSCVNECLDSCGCNAAIYSNTSFECWQLSQILQNGTHNSGRAVTAYIRIPSISNATSTFPTVAIVIISIAFTAIILSVLLFIRYLLSWIILSVLLFIRYLLPWRRARNERAESSTLLHLTENVGAPKRFSYQELLLATAGFSEDRKLGSGGFGSVFKGVLHVEQRGEVKRVPVAVKRLNKAENRGREGENDFLVEVETLASIRHVNVVSLVGYCAEGTERLLVYELVPNGSLASHLFDSKPEAQPLQWETRLQIVMGAAIGIDYLHTQCPKKIVHRDIKPPNILLDRLFQAKVADFGVAQIMGESMTHVTNLAPGGTPTYMAPECWVMGGIVTEKTDVYSFGVTILEIVSGRRMSRAAAAAAAAGVGGEGRRRTFSFEEAFTLMEEKRFSEFADDRLQGKYNVEDLERLVKVAFWCLHQDSSQRPTMAELLQMVKDGDRERLRDPSPEQGISHEAHIPVPPLDTSVYTLLLAESPTAPR